MLTYKQFPMEHLPKFGPYLAARYYGIYAFRIMGPQGANTILASNCKELTWDENNDLWYIPNNNDNVINVVERWVWVPFSSILSIAFNEKRKPDE